MTEPTDKVEVRKARPAPRWAAPLAALALAAAVWLVFRPVLGYEFVGYDEQWQVVENPLVRSLSAANLAAVFTSRSVTSYYPFRTLSLAVDHAVWGMDPTGFHLTNLVLHTANVVLLFWLALRLVRRAAGSAETWAVASAALGAGLFALHPVVVEPVAWIGAREELLLVLGAVACMHLHLSARAAETRTRRTGGRAVALHGGAVLACIVACGSNVVGAVIAPIVTLWDVLTLPGPRAKRILATVAPLWAVCTAAVLIKVIEGPASPGGAGEALPALDRAMFVLSLLWANLWALIWPARLTVDYPGRVPAGLLEPRVLLGLASALGLAAVLWVLRRRRAAFLGLGWFLLALAPTLQVLPHHVDRADRFLYLPLAGLSIGAAAGLARLSREPARLFAAGLAVFVLAGWGWRSVGQVPVWRDTEALFGHCLELNPTSVTAHNNLAVLRASQGRPDLAEEHLRLSLAQEPRRADTHYNLGRALTMQGRTEEAVTQFREALRLSSGHAEAHNSLANVFARTGRHEAALPHYRQALAADPLHVQARTNLASALMALDDYDAAEGHLRRAIAIDPAYANAHRSLAVLVTRQGRFAEAVRAYRAFLRLRPDDPSVTEALVRLLAACDDPEVRDGPAAVRLAESLVARSGRGDPRHLDALALAYAAVEDFGRAADAAREALRLARRAGDERLAREIEGRLDRYIARTRSNERPSP